MRDLQGTSLGTIAFRQLAQGGGGWQTGAQFTQDGTLYLRNDTSGAHRLDPGAKQQRQLVRLGLSIPEADSDGIDGGAYEIMPCWSDSSRVYMLIADRLFRSDNKGENWARCPAFPMPTVPERHRNSNETGRMLGPMGMVDPANPDVVLIGTPDGAYMTLDGGNSFILLNVIPAPAHEKPEVPFNGWSAVQNRMLVAFDLSSPVVGGRTQGIYVWSENRQPNGSGGIQGGLFHSTNAGANWTKDAACPKTTAGCLRVRPNDGAVALAGRSIENGGPLSLKVPGQAWITPATGGAAKAVAFHSTDLSKIVIVGSGGGVQLSTDGGANFGGERASRRVGGDVPWLDWTNEGYMSMGEAISHPSIPGIIVSMGIGMAYLDDAFDPQTPDAEYRIKAQGVDQMIPSQMKVIYKPGHRRSGTLLLYCQDRSSFAYARGEVDQYPRVHAPNRNSSINHSGGGDWAWEDPDFEVFTTVAKDGNNLWMSENARQSWKHVPTKPLDNGGFMSFHGNIALGSKDVVLYMGTNQAPPQISIDGMRSWSWLQIGTRPAGPGSIIGFHRHYTIAGQKVIADKLHATPRFYFTAAGREGPKTPNDWSGPQWHDDPDEIAHRGIFRVDVINGAVTVTRMCDVLGRISHFIWNNKLKQNLKRPGHFGHCGGHDQGPLFISTNHCVDGSWVQCPLFDVVYDFDFMQAAPGQPYEALLVAGIRAGTGLYGQWLVRDFNPVTGTGTPELLARRPLGVPSGTNFVAADLERFGRGYVGSGGSGTQVLDYVSRGVAVPA